MTESSTKLSLTSLPAELLHYIFRHLEALGNFKCLATLLACSRQTFQLVAPYLYRDLTLTRENAGSIFCGVGIEALTESSGIYTLRGIDPTRAKWDQLLSKEYYREWQYIWGEAPEKSQHQYLLWPEDHAADLAYTQNRRKVGADGGNLPKELLAGEHGALRESTSPGRKIALLGMTKRLPIASLPSMALSAQLAGLDQALFKNLIYLILGPVAFWSFLNHEDFHHKDHPRRSQHPFLSVWRTLQPYRMCIQLPIVDEYSEKSYILPRVLTGRFRGRDGPRYPGEGPPRERPFREEFSKLMKEGLTSQLATLTKDWDVLFNLHRLTLHNVVQLDSCIMPGDFPLRLFFRLCACCVPEINSFEIECHYCHDHVIDEERIELIPDLIANMGLRDIEFIDADWTEGDAEPLNQSIRIRKMEDKVWVLLRREHDPDGDHEAFVDDEDSSDGTEGDDEALEQGSGIEVIEDDVSELLRAEDDGDGDSVDGNEQEDGDETEQEDDAALTLKAIRETIAFTNSMDAMPCECCGKAQLSYQDCTIYPKRK